MLEVVHEAKYIYFHSNEAIYLNILALFQNMELHIIGTWVHLSKYLLFVNSLSLFKLFNEERAMQKTQAYVKHTIWNPHTTKYIFLVKRNKFKKSMVSTLLSRHTRFHVAPTSIWDYNAIWVLNR